ncbi:hypothetical protein [Dysgonomonas capnocytophagoides]|uniref:hypothetical protein n=1 Tax=Dysgonomonas capnocytophagoides TaxID=45254 RepID=UPI002A7EC1C0|nr:hypothetical protein [Dysgonomonas capnocytophagoides]
MDINFRTIRRYDARIMSFDLQNSAIERSIINESFIPIGTKPKLKPRPMELKIEFRNKLRLSQFFEDLIQSDQILIDINDGFIYRCTLKQMDGNITSIANRWHQLIIPLYAIQSATKRRVCLESPETLVIVAGTHECDVIYELFPKENGSININGIKIDNVKAGSTVIIDGINKLITENGANAFGRSNLRKFPSLPAGENVITLDKDIDAFLYYYPVFA